MVVAVWAAFTLLLVVIVAGGAVTISRTISTLREFRSLRRTIGAGLDEILRRTADVERRLALAGEQAARLDAAVARLQGSRARAAVLAAAFADVRLSVMRLRGAFPRK